MAEVHFISKLKHEQTIWLNTCKWHFFLEFWPPAVIVFPVIYTHVFSPKSLCTWYYYKWKMFMQWLARHIEKLEHKHLNTHVYRWRTPWYKRSFNFAMTPLNMIIEPYNWLCILIMVKQHAIHRNEVMLTVLTGEIRSTTGNRNQVIKTWHTYGDLSWCPVYLMTSIVTIADSTLVLGFKLKLQLEFKMSIM